MLGMEWSGVEWNKWNGMEWNGMEWNGVEWSGKKWKEVERSERRSVVHVDNARPHTTTVTSAFCDDNVLR
jgi:hypothetical protein